VANTIKVSVLGDVKDINNKLGQVNQQLGGFGKTAGKIGTLVKTMFAGFVVGQVVQGVKSVVQAASDAEQSIGATETVFGKFSKTVIDQSKKAATEYGLSANVYRQNSNLLGSLFANQGVAADQLAKKTQQNIGIAADLAATYGGDTTQAVEALSAAYRGEYEQLERYGISMKQSTVNTEAAALAKKKYGKELKDLAPEQQRALEREAKERIIRQQSGKTTGAYARESKTLAHQQQVLSAQFANLKVTLGNLLLPVLTKVFTFINDKVIPGVQRLADGIKPVIARIKEFFKAGEGGTGTGPFATLVTFIKTQVVPAVQGIVTAYHTLVQTIIPIINQVVDGMKKKWGEIKPYLVDTWTSVREIIVGVLNIIKTHIQNVTEVIKFIWQNFGGSILEFVTTSFRNIAQVISGVMQVISGIVKLVLSIMKGDWSGAWNAIKQIVSGVLRVIGGLIRQGMATARAVMSMAWTAIKGVTSAAWAQIKAGVSSGIASAVTYMKGLPGKAKAALGDIGGLLLSAGEDMMRGFIQGVKNMAQQVAGAALDVAKGAVGAVTDFLKIRSPSRRFREIGQYTMKGLALGLKDGEKNVRKQMLNVTKTIQAAYDQELRADQAALTKRMRKQKKSDKQIAAAKKRLEVRSDKRANRAVRSLANENRALTINARKREVVYKKLADAQKKLADLQKQAADYKQNVVDSVLQYGNITSLNTAFTANAMAQQLQDRLNKVKKYNALLTDLAKRGLNKTMYDQLVQAGVEGGLATATALAAGGPEAIKQFNNLQAQLNTEANRLGTASSNAMYGAGIQAAQGLVKGLQSQSKALEKEATKLANKLAKAIKKALKIKSPSRVFKRIGEYTTAGLRVGLEDTSGVEKAMVRIGQVMAGSYDPSLEKAMAGKAAASAASGNTYNINITAPANVDKVAMGRDIRELLDAHERAGGRQRA